MLVSMLCYACREMSVREHHNQGIASAISGTSRLPCAFAAACECIQ